jgi:hypothetical protein
MIILRISVYEKAEVLALALQLVFTRAMHRLLRTESADCGRALPSLMSGWAVAGGERNGVVAGFRGRVR